MSSQLNVDTIVDKAGSGGTNVKMANTSTYVDGSVAQNTVQGLAKAFHGYGDNAAGTLNANSATLNIASYVDQGTGQSALFLTNPVTNTKNCVTGSTQGYDYGFYLNSTTEYRAGNISSTGSYSDGVTHTTVHGDLA